MRVWVDADACPGEIKELLFKAARKREVPTTLVANASIRIPSSKFIDCVVVPHGANVADKHITEHAVPGDLVVTADIPLASDVVAKGVLALNPRGEFYTEANIGARLAVRNLLDNLRGSGEITGGPSGFSAKDRQAFANQFDRWLTKAKAS